MTSLMNRPTCVQQPHNRVLMFILFLFHIEPYFAVCRVEHFLGRFKNGTKVNSDQIGMTLQRNEVANIY